MIWVSYVLSREEKLVGISCAHEHKIQLKELDINEGKLVPNTDIKQQSIAL